jgi:ATP-binding cassette subfamily B protein
MKVFTRTDSSTIKPTLEIFRAQMRADKKHVVLFSILIPIGQFLRFIALPLIVSFIIQSLILEPHNINKPLTLIGLATIVMIISTITNNRGFTMLFDHQERAQTSLMHDGIDSIMKKSYQFFADRKVGTLSGDLLNFSRSYLEIMDNYFLHTNHLIISYLFSLIIIAILAPILLLPALGLVIIIISLNIRNLRERAVYRDQRKILASRLAGSVADILGNQQLVRIFATEKTESKTIMRERHKIAEIAGKEIRIIERESFYRQFFLYAFQLSILLAFVWMVSHDMVSIAAMIFTFTYINRTTDTIFEISSIVRKYEQVFLDAAPMIEVLNTPNDIEDSSNAQKLIVTKGHIALKQLEFSYGDRVDEYIFKGLSIDIPSGQRVGLAGPSGGGKTTLTKLLLRFANVQAGEIAIDGQNIAQVSQSSLRQNIAYVPQDPFLFHRSLRENIAYGKPKASDKQIIEAAKQAYAWEFIEKLPNGLDTVVGERGVKLSGGQRQRVAIARAILKDSPILVLDEATSALDSESESMIQLSLENLMIDRTCIVIAHRLSTIAKLDRIIVLDRGQVIEDGSHQQLLSDGKLYASLWHRQSDGFIDTK